MTSTIRRRARWAAVAALLAAGVTACGSIGYTTYSSSHPATPIRGSATDGATSGERSIGTATSGNGTASSGSTGSATGTTPGGGPGGAGQPGVAGSGSGSAGGTLNGGGIAAGRGGGAAAPVAAPWSAAPAPGGSGSFLFGSDSAFGLSVARAPVAANSAATVAILADDVTRQGAGVNWQRWNVAFYSVPAGTTRVSVRFADCFASGTVPPVFTAAMSAVPIPADAQPALADDRHMAIYDAATDQLWEMWRAENTPSGWQACWGGRIDNASQAAGYFSDGGGATASKLSMVGTMITLAEARAGRINHAVYLVVPTVRADSWSYPAQRTDGNSTNADAVMEGQRLRLDPSLDVAKLGLTPFGAMVARAAQQYGFIVVDKAGAVGVVTESGLPTKVLTGTDPWPGLLQLGTYDQYRLLAGFPWNRLQALPPDYGRP